MVARFDGCGFYEHTPALIPTLDFDMPPTGRGASLKAPLPVGGISKSNASNRAVVHP